MVITQYNSKVYILILASNTYVTFCFFPHFIRQAVNRMMSRGAKSSKQKEERYTFNVESRELEQELFNYDSDHVCILKWFFFQRYKIFFNSI